MLYCELLIILVSIWLGSRLGGVAVGLASCFGLLMFALLGIKPGDTPFELIEIILVIISAIATLESAGGISYLAKIAERFLKSHPKRITFFAPLAAYLMTLLVGISYMVLSLLPIIVRVAKAHGVRPSRPLSMAVIASQMAVIASPLSPALLFVAQQLEPLGISYLQVLVILIPATLAATLIAALASNFSGCELQDDPVYKERLSKNLVHSGKTDLELQIPPYAKRALMLFFLGIVATTGYAIATSSSIALVQPQILSKTQATILVMLTTALLITWLCRVDPKDIVKSSTFKAGTSSCICIMGVAWLGNTFFTTHLAEFKQLAEVGLQNHPWSLAIILFFSSILLYSQAVTAKVMIPVALTMALSPTAILSAFPAASALFILPNYPVLLAAVDLDDTGSTRIGKFIFNHPFLIPGTITIVLAVIFASLLATVVIP